MRQVVSGFMVLVVAFFCLNDVRAAQITLADFSGSETLIDFTPGFYWSEVPVLYEGVTFSSAGHNAFGEMSIAFQAEHEFWAEYFDNIPGASLGIAMNDNAEITEMTMAFSTPVNRVGLLLSTGMSTFELTALGDDLGALGSVTVTMPGAGEAVFAGVEFDQNISQIVITEPGNNNGSITLMDDLRFEATGQSVPDSASTMLLLSSGLLGLAAFRRKA